MEGYIQNVKQKNYVLYLKNGQSRYDSCYGHSNSYGHASVFSHQYAHCTFAKRSDPKLRDLDKFFSVAGFWYAFLWPILCWSTIPQISARVV
jgi:hypothetical protein